MKQDEEKKRRKKEQDKIDPRLLLNNIIKAVQVKNKEVKGIIDFIHLLSDKENVESEENFNEDNSDSNNFKEVDFTTFNHHYYK
jgi:hypothetical protein